MVNLIAWAFGKVPDAEFIHCSYSTPLAVNNSTQVRNLVQHEAFTEIFPELRLATDAGSHWKTTAGGVMYATGTRGTITGFGAGKRREGFGGATIIDDPHKADEAKSDTIHKGVIDWFQNTLESRKNSPDTPIIVIMQRLHEDDLTGWLLGDRGKDGNGPPVAGGNGEVWEQLRLSAWVGEDEEPLWPEKHSADELRRMEKANPYVFAGQYRQLPAPPSGGVIKPDLMPVVEAIPAGVVEWCRGRDLGASGDGDYTAGGKVGRLADGRYIIADMKREQFETNLRDQPAGNGDRGHAREVGRCAPQPCADPGRGRGGRLLRRRASAACRLQSSGGPGLDRRRFGCLS